MIDIDKVVVSVTPVGAAGSATANTTTTSKVRGKLIGVYCNFAATAHANTDTTIATAGTSTPAVTLLTLTDVNTDGWYYPRVQVHDAADGSALTLDGTRKMVEPFYIDDYVKVTLAQSTAAESVFTLIFET